MNWEGSFQISRCGRVLADFAFHAISLPPSGGEGYIVVSERGGGGRSVIIRGNDDLFLRMSGKAGKEFMLKACTDLMRGFEAVHCGGESILHGVPDGKVEIDLHCGHMGFDAMSQLDEWVKSCRRGKRTKFLMHKCVEMDSADVHLLPTDYD